MSQLELRSVHPVEAKEITPLGTWLIYRVVLGMAFVFNLTPFVIYFSQH